MGLPGIRTRISLLLVFLLADASVCLREGVCGLYVEFLVDRSGSMWAPWQDRPKIVGVQEALEEIVPKLPDDVALGLRVYPAYPGETEGRDHGLRIPIELGNRDRFPLELGRLNPQGKDALAGHLRSALQDFPEGAQGRLLILICDAADIQGSSFCSMSAFEGLQNGLEFHIVTLDLQDPAERQELACLGKQLNGSVEHLAGIAGLPASLLTIIQSARRKEAERHAQDLQEQLARKALQEKTRLRVSFQNTLDPFFADSVEVVQCELDGLRVQLPPLNRLKKGEKVLLFDSPAAKGSHRLSIQHRLWSEARSVYSREGNLEVNLEQGKTLSVLCSPQGRLFTWGCRFESTASE